MNSYKECNFCGGYRMIQIAVVEDEEIYVKQLTEYIRKYQTERGRSIKVTVFGDGEDITENYSGSCIAVHQVDDVGMVLGVLVL